MCVTPVALVWSLLIAEVGLNVVRADDAYPLDAVTVTATRVGRPAFEIPASIDRIELGTPGLRIGPGEALLGVAGVAARDRQNYAQDAQIAIRGFGARSPFGIRGVRLLLDGIPATQPDGQGQISNFPFAEADRLEVLRGPLSVLYGNSSGGVVQLFTSDPPEVAGGQFSVFGGSHGDGRFTLSAGDRHAVISLTGFRTDGERPHSAAQRQILHGKWVHPMAGGKLTITGNTVTAPNAQDPLGLTRTQFDSDPQQVAPEALRFNTRKSLSQLQLGAVFERDQEWGQWRAMVYGGRRNVQQFLAIPAAAQANPTSAGGVIDLATDYGGGDLRLSSQIGTLRFTVGSSIDALRQHRRGYENFVGAELGTRGRLRRDEVNDVTAFDQFMQLHWQPSERLGIDAGIRHIDLEIRSQDFYLAPGNGDDGGSIHYSAWTPVFGLLFRQSDRTHWYAAYGRGFETPTLVELAYRPDGSSGLNSALRPSRSNNFELGAKFRTREGLRANLATFWIDTDQELVVASNRGGRASYSNATETRRQGAELALTVPLGTAFALTSSYSYLDAEVARPYLTCISQPCIAANNQVAKGTPLPGIPRQQAYVRISYAPDPDWSVSVSGQYVSEVSANDIARDVAPGYGLLDAQISKTWHLGAQRLRVSLAGRNLTDSNFVGSVIVNDANGRYFEPGRGRTLLLGSELFWGLP